MNEQITPGQNVNQPAATAGTNAEPTPIELKEDSLVKLPGSDKPVKYVEWFRDYQGRYTKATQESSTLKRQLAQIEAQRQQDQAELQRLRASGQQPVNRPDPRATMRDRLSKLQYLNGEEAAQLYEDLHSQFEQRDQALQTRDMALRVIAMKVSEALSRIDELSQRNTSTDLKGKIAKFKSELGLPDGTEEFLEDLYSAYEGEDLDTEFPNIVKARWEQVTSAIRALDKAKVEQAKKARFVPGRGGTLSPSKPIDVSDMDAREAADFFWKQMHDEGNET